MGELWDQTKHNFQKLGTTATHTDLANLADDYPKLLVHATQFDQLPAWLVDAADRLALAGFWNAFGINTNNIPGNTASAVFARGARGLWTYRNGTLEDAHAHARLAKAAHNPLLPQNARDFFTLRNAYVMQLSAGCDIGLPELATLTRQECSVGVQARYWIANAALLQADSQGCLDSMPTPDELPALTGDYWINVGYAHFQCAQTEKAVQAQEKTLQHARSTRSPVAEGEALSYLSWSECWANSQSGQAHAREGIRLAQEKGNLVDEQRSQAALAVALAGVTTEEEFQTALQRAESLAYQTGNRIAGIRASFARAWHAAVINDTEALGRHIDEIDRLASSINSGEHWADIARAWLPGYTREHTELAKRWEWLDSADETMGRWWKLLEDRRALAG